MSIMAEQRGVKSVSPTFPNALINEGVKLNATHKSVLAILKKNRELTAQ